MSSKSCTFNKRGFYGIRLDPTKSSGTSSDFEQRSVKDTLTEGSNTSRLYSVIARSRYRGQREKVQLGGRREERRGDGQEARVERKWVSPKSEILNNI